MQILKHKGKKPEVFKRPEGQAHKAIRQALGNAQFVEYKTGRFGMKKVLGEWKYYEKEEPYFCPLTYAGRKTAQKRIDKLKDAGILCNLLGYSYMYIEFLAYTPETEQKLIEEDNAANFAEEQWKEQQLKAA